MQWCHGFMLSSMEDIWIFIGGDQLSGTDLPEGTSATPFFSLVTHPSAVAVPDVAFVFLHQIIWTVNQSHNCPNLAPGGGFI